MTPKTRIHIFDGPGDPKTFHFAFGAGKVHAGRVRTLCGKATGGMRHAAPFAPGDTRGDVHVKFLCDDCGGILIGFTDAADGVFDLENCTPAERVGAILFHLGDAE
jgi:hypothetical protein